MAGIETPASIRPMLKAADEIQRTLLVDEVIRVAEIAAPTFKEQRRAEYVLSQFAQAGLAVRQDSAGNAIGVLKGTSDLAPLLMTAHMDTVFGDEVDVTPSVSGDYLLGPGVRDNSAAVASLIQFARLAQRTRWRPARDIILAGTVGEEGLGNLRGIKQLVADMGSGLSAALIIDGYLGSITHIGVGSRRFRISVTAKGGHSWQDYGQPSATHALGSIIHRLAELKLPREPRCSLNVGTISGGSGVNVIADKATLSLDLRSVSEEELARLERQVRDIVDRVTSEAGVSAEIALMGERPAGSIPADHPFVRAAERVLQNLGIEATLGDGSTEANLPASVGIQALAVGSATGNGVHTLKERLFIPSLMPGLKQEIMLAGLMSEETTPVEAENV